jgi:His-Xaa-Ser system radical SAM maturase HxsC
MGWNVTLALHGTATTCRVKQNDQLTSVIRLRNGGSDLSVKSDFAIVRSKSELKNAIARRSDRIAIISDEKLDDIGEDRSVGQLVVLPARFDYLEDGDIIGIRSTSKQFRTLYRRKSSHNSFLVTDRCNHYCLMCSQPPKDVDDRWIIKEINEALPLVDKATKSIGFTGGEPLTDWADFIDVLAICRDELPTTAIHVLSNGRAFIRDDVVTAWTNVRHPNITVGIPIYSAVDHVHDYVVQARGAFDETVFGILKLKDKGNRVEIRVVLHSITAPRIVETCRWIARNLPFVDHVALMGLENIGFAIANADLLWIDPLDYQKELARAVDFLISARINVSVYNLQRCVLDRSVWPYAAQSISDWKNGYLEECNRCIEKPNCSGFFTSGRPRRSRAIMPILSAL